ncbi:MAG TPA: hypothetical protein VL547_23150 [Dinghuibacter sp.]|uniref:hypothetical protein n=1 Tax=Dinghuibacter sp. TaxID=2024697 RepID=UPI002B94100B|nr:hypothetical protein [Dinghuibacter sp.]HTJ14962.1 hypothetical protein [Dinghuibacter sp.]
MENRVPGEDLLTEHIANLDELQRQGYESTVRHGRNTLFWIAALLVVSQVLISYAHQDLTLQLLGIILLLGTLFAALGFYTRRKPFVALLTGTVCYVLLWSIDLFCGYARGSVNVTTGISGALVRVAFTLFLIKALPDAWKLERLARTP